MDTEHNVFAGAYIDRAAEHRADARWQAGALEEPATRFVLVSHGACLADEDNARLKLLGRRELEQEPVPGQAIFLGLSDAAPVFAIATEAAERYQGPAARFVDLRSLGLLLAPREANLAAHACAMVRWLDTQAYCTRCGSPMQVEAAGHASGCVNPDCRNRCFPRVDPAIIVLVTRDQRCLLGRQPAWPKNRYSTIAGFVEPGESLEDAVVREVFEETNIRVSEVRYQSSQPWPFPASLMLGFRARAATGDIRRNDGELEDVRWFTHAELVAGTIGLAARQSIARRLIDAWIAEQNPA